MFKEPGRLEIIVLYVFCFTERLPALVDLILPEVAVLVNGLHKGPEDCNEWRLGIMRDTVADVTFEHLVQLLWLVLSVLILKHKYEERLLRKQSFPIGLR